jgi:AcrR family transcriptional regulator
VTIKLNHAQKRQTRAVHTRQELIDAARQVFAQKGYEQARLEEIAASAGKTRGAFYDHFKDKEDVFFAIFEEDISHYQQQVSREFEQAATLDQRIEALTRHLFHILEDRNRILLDLEFKMYAIRHPQEKARLANLRLTMCVEGMKDTLEILMPEWRTLTDDDRRRLNVQFGALLEGLLVNRLFDPGALNDEQTVVFIRSALRSFLIDADGQA